jgi:hypothetical protein
MKLDVNVLRYLSKDDFRVLTAVEMGQKNVSAERRRARRVWSAPPPGTGDAGSEEAFGGPMLQRGGRH